MALNPRQRAFVREYPKDRSAKQAAIRAGYSEKTATQIGSRLFKKLILNKTIAQDEAAADEALLRWKAELEQEAYANVPMHHMTHDNKLKSLDMLGRHLGAYQGENGSVAQAFQINIHIGARNDGE